MKHENRDREDSPVRLSRGFRKLQGTVHRYLNDSGGWIDDVQQTLRELSRLASELDAREQQVQQREARVDQREQQLDQLLMKLASD